MSDATPGKSTASTGPARGRVVTVGDFLLGTLRGRLIAFIVLLISGAALNWLIPIVGGLGIALGLALAKVWPRLSRWSNFHHRVAIIAVILFFTFGPLTWFLERLMAFLGERGFAVGHPSLGMAMAALVPMTAYVVASYALQRDKVMRERAQLNADDGNRTGYRHAGRSLPAGQD